jgi:hypothetical protein
MQLQRRDAAMMQKCGRSGCNTKFKQKRKWQKYCCDDCRWKQWDLENPRQKKSDLQSTFIIKEK